MQIVSLGDNLHEISYPISCANLEKTISKCCRLIDPSM